MVQQKDNNKTLVNDFTSGSITDRLLKFATPLFLGNVLQVIYNMVDMIIVGNVLGKAGLSAVSIGGDLNNFLTLLAMGFTNAGTIIISQYIGAGQRKNVGRFIGTFSLSLGIGAIAMTLISALLHENILRWMHTPPEAYEGARIYCLTCILGLIFIYGYNAVAGVMRGMGDSRHPFIFILIASVMNIVLDCIMVIFLGMGTFGAALATIISQGFSFICALVFLARSRERLGFEIDRSCFRIDRGMLSTLIKLGTPMALKSTSVAFSKMFVNSYANSFGVTVSAVSGIGSKLNNVMAQCSNAFNTAAASMIGQNIGAEKYDRVPKIMLSTFSLVAVLSCVFSLAVIFWPELVFGMFTDDPDVLKVSMEFIPVAVVIFIGAAFRSPSNALSNGTGNYAVNFAIAILDAIVFRIGLAILLGIVMNLGYVGFWFGDALAGYTPFIISGIFFLSGKWKTNKYVIKK